MCIPHNNRVKNEIEENMKTIRTASSPKTLRYQPTKLKKNSSKTTTS